MPAAYGPPPARPNFFHHCVVPKPCAGAALLHQAQPAVSLPRRGQPAIRRSAERSKTARFNPSGRLGWPPVSVPHHCPVSRPDMGPAIARSDIPETRTAFPAPLAPRLRTRPEAPNQGSIPPKLSTRSPSGRHHLTQISKRTIHGLINPPCWRLSWACRAGSGDSPGRATFRRRQFPDGPATCTRQSQPG